MEFANHEPRPEQIDIQTDQGFSPKVSEENSAPLKNEVDYSKIPAGFKKGYNLRDLPTSPPERAKEHSNGAMPVAKSSRMSGKAETGTARNEQVVSGSQVAYNSQDSPTPTRDSTESGKASQPSKAGGLAGNQDTRIAQFSENGVYEDPFTGLFKVIVGGAITMTVDTWGAANELLQRALQSSGNESDNNEQGKKKADEGSNTDGEAKARHGGGKNAQHGRAENQPSKEQQLEDYNARLEELNRTQGPKKEKIQLKDKIEKIKKAMAKDKKGTIHTKNAKGSNGQPRR
jgi:hypothetical protein